jgi:hypothetical protein
VRTLQYLHHAKAIINKPYHTGFFFKIWDQLFGSIYAGECVCCKSVCAESSVFAVRMDCTDVACLCAFAFGACVLLDV